MTAAAAVPAALPTLTPAGPLGRWTGLGPYYAMFPVRFAFETVARYSSKGNAVLDPFAGRATAVYAAAAQGRAGVGIEIHPVGWLYGRAKLNPASRANVERRLSEIAEAAAHIDARAFEALPEFYHKCYAPRVLRFLLAARANLSWRKSKVDATLMSLLLVSLHGRRGTQAVSNQMRQGKALYPQYSLRWWAARKLEPPDLDPEEFFLGKIAWRYAKGLPELEPSSVRLGDATEILPRLVSARCAVGARPFDLVLTSPPYWGVTNYYKDQWLRIWMLGGHTQHTPNGSSWGRAFASKADYRSLLERVFAATAEAVGRRAVIYVRTDAREFTRETTREVLEAAFPSREIEVHTRPYSKATQTALFGDKSEKPGEVDIVVHNGRSTKAPRRLAARP